MDKEEFLNQLVTDFRCPKCKSPHFGSSQKPGEDRVYYCHGNEWRGTPSCGWSGSIDESFIETTLREREAFEVECGVEEFFGRTRP